MNPQRHRRPICDDARLSEETNGHRCFWEFFEHRHTATISLIADSGKNYFLRIFFVIGKPAELIFMRLHHTPNPSWIAALNSDSLWFVGAVDHIQDVAVEFFVLNLDAGEPTDI